MFSSESCYHILKQLTSSRKFLIGYSGGLDSHVLLHCLAAIRTQYPDISLTAIHINHGLSPNAESWVEHCLQVCQSLAVTLIIKNINIDETAGEGLEAAARTARYQAYAEHLSAGTCLVTAHSKNDQAETVLLQLFRGAGVKGLSAMPACKKIAASFLLRPLLNFTRAELENYARQHQLVWIEDESNVNLQFGRNFVRSEILPLIQQRWPDAVNSLTRSARHSADADILITTLAQDDLQQIWAAPQEKTLSIKRLLLLPGTRQANVIRAWLQQLDFPLPSAVKLRQILREVLSCAEDANPVVAWRGTQIRRYQDNLYALPVLSAHDSSWSGVWDLQTPFQLPHALGKLTAKIIVGDGLALPPTQQVTIRFRQGGERCRPAGRSGSHPLKKLLQEWQVPPWQRDRVPLIYVDNALAAVVGHCVCENFIAKKWQQGLLFSL